MNRQAVALRIAPDHAALAGHFPGSPVVPGVLLLDETLHAIERAAPVGCFPAGSLWHIGTVKFHRPVRPGESLLLEYELQPDGRARFELRAADALVASGTIERRAAAELIAMPVP